MRLATVVWHNNYRWVMGINWGGRTDKIRTRLADMIANGEMTPEAFVAAAAVCTGLAGPDLPVVGAPNGVGPSASGRCDFA